MAVKRFLKQKQELRIAGKEMLESDGPRIPGISIAK
jgi:hypothetical protein